MSNSNQSSPSLTYAPHPWTIWYWLLRGIIAIIAVLGNGMVVWLIISRRKLWTRPNCFVLSLSLADFCAGAINTPLEFCCTMLGTSCSSWLMQAIKDMFIVASVFNLCAMTIDRYVAVIHSLRYPRIMNDKTCVLVIATAWGLGISIPWIFYIIRIRELHTYRIISIFRLLFSNALPMAGLVLAYFRMLRISRKHRRKVGQQRQQVDFNYLNKRRVNARSDNRSAVRFIGSMVTFFVFCYSLTFYRVLSSYILFISVPYVIVPVSRLLYYMNSALNCLVYALFKKDIRTEARNLFCRTATEQ